MERITGAHTDNARHSINLAGVWRFQPDASGDGERMGYHRPECDTRFWREVSVPIAFDDCLPELTGYEGAGWFRCEFELSEECASQHLSLRFEGVNNNAQVWVNGQPAGGHAGGFLRFELPVARLLRPGLNTLVVRADNTRRQGEAPGRERGRPWPGGILREVALDCRPLIRLDRLAIVAEAAGVFETRVTVINDTDETCEAGVALAILDANGAMVFSSAARAATVPAHDASPLTITGMAPGITPWSPERPALYTFSVGLAHTAGFDEIKARAGFRTIARVGQRLVLNGEPIRLRGFNRHEDTARAGMTPDLEQAGRDLRHMKQLGANFVRLCGHPRHPAELDLCDEIGLLVMGEISLRDSDQPAAARSDTARRQLSEMIARDINHPAIILWGVSGEAEEQQPEAAAGSAALVELARQLDRSRLAAHVSDHWTTRPAFEADDVICVNGYPSRDGRGRASNPAYDFSASARWWTEHLDMLRALYPDKPILITEFGYPALHSVADNGLGEDAQDNAIRAEAQAFDKPYVCGMTIWCYADHAWPEEPFVNAMTISPFGVVTRDRRPKRALGSVAALYGGASPAFSAPSLDNAPVVMTRPHLNDIPEIAFPEGYGIRPMRHNEGGLWEDIQRDAEPFFTVEPGLFEREFGHDPGAIPRRCYLIVGPDGCAVGTISAWYERNFKGQDWGRVHWVAVRRAHQGRGLAKAGLSFTLRQLARWHERAMLDTSTGRVAAIRLYLDFGFAPDLDPPFAREAWAAFRQRLDHPALRDV